MSVEQLSRKNDIVCKLKENGCRMTKQRMLLLDILLEEDCASCKEIYYKASSVDQSIGTATVYRMINTLKDLGVVEQRLYWVA